MKRWLPFAALIAILGCKAKHEASTGKEWLEKFQAAAEKKDGETCWKMISKDSRAQFIESVKQIREIVKAGGEGAQMFKADWQLEKDISTYSDEELAKIMLMKKEQSMKSAYVEEKVEGSLVLLTLERGGRKEKLALVKEEKYLRYDLKATMEKNAP